MPFRQAALFTVCLLISTANFEKDCVLEQNVPVQMPPLNSQTGPCLPALEHKTFNPGVLQKGSSRSLQKPSMVGSPTRFSCCYFSELQFNTKVQTSVALFLYEVQSRNSKLYMRDSLHSMLVRAWQRHW